MKLRYNGKMNDEPNHARLRAFLQQQTMLPLPPHVLDKPQRDYIKAGIIPFIVTEKTCRFYVLKPQAAHAELGAPEFQLCKGTRMHWQEQGGWQDIRHPNAVAGEWETLAETALREGSEELGLRLENIRALYDAGGFCFSSASTGKDKQVWLFAAEMVSADDFLPDAQVAATTAERRWMTLAEFTAAGRGDHIRILQDIAGRLSGKE